MYLKLKFFHQLILNLTLLHIEKVEWKNLKSHLNIKRKWLKFYFYSKSKTKLLYFFKIKHLHEILLASQKSF